MSHQSVAAGKNTAAAASYSVFGVSDMYICDVVFYVKCDLSGNLRGEVI